MWEHVVECLSVLCRLYYSLYLIFSAESLLVIRMGFLVLVVPRMTSYILHVIHINKKKDFYAIFFFSFLKSELDKKILTKKHILKS